VRIFVGYHYGDNEAWVKNLVYRLIEAFGDEVESGEKLYKGPNISAAITEKIESCDALIGIATRDKLVDGYYTTHPWVQHELVAAQQARKLWVQVRETQLDRRQGILEGTQYIEYESTNLPECLVKLAEAIGEWHKPRNPLLYLLPAEFATAVTPLLDRRGFLARYRLLDRNHSEIGPFDTRIVNTPGRLCVKLKDISPEHLIQIEVCFGKWCWKSGWVKGDDNNIFMEPS